MMPQLANWAEDRNGSDTAAARVPLTPHGTTADPQIPDQRCCIAEIVRVVPPEVHIERRCLWLLVQSGCLKSPASDLVVVPGAVAEDVAIKSDAELPINRAGSNCNVVVPVTFPEQHRTALLAESSPPRIA